MPGYISLRSGWLTSLARSFSRLNWRVGLGGLGLFGLFVALLGLVQFATPNLIGNDGYYHIKLAQIMGQEGWRPAFPWLPLTVLNTNQFVDHHFLYHLLLIPFTTVDLRLGVKWASVLFPALTFVTGWLLLRSQRVPGAALWAVGFLAVSEAFLYRMSMPRAQALSLLVLLVALHLTLTGRYRWLGLLGFVYVWLYNAFPLLLALVGVYTAMTWLLAGRLDLRPLGYTGLGLAVGLIVNPYFPDNLLFIYHHLMPKLTEATSTSVGNEWYPYKSWTLVENSGPALLLLVSGAFALGLREKRLDIPTATAFGLAILFGLMLFKARRFVEYFPAFALIFAALAWSPLIRTWIEARLPLFNSGGSQPAPAHLTWSPPWRKQLLAGLAILVLGPAIWLNLTAARESVQGSGEYQRYAGASGWLVANSPAGSRVFQTDWDDFPRLFFHNSHNTYTVGLDPTYLQSYDAELYELWVDLTRGRVAQPGQIIADRFGASYVITDLKHQSFLEETADDPWLAEVYRDDEAVVLQVVSPEEDGQP